MRGDRKIIEELAKANEELSEAVRILSERINQPILALATPDLNYIIMNTTLILGTSAITSLVLLDSATLQPNTTATFASTSVTSDTPTVATFVLDATTPNQIDATPVAVGTGNLLITSTVTYTDSDTGKSVTAVLSASIPFTVSPVPEGVQLSITGFTNVVAPVTTTSTTSTTTTTQTS